jgi:tetratricopeptide (TPR) repeat protein
VRPWGPEPALLERLLVLLAAACLFGSTLGPPDGYDIFFHLRMGEEIARRGAVPHDVSFLGTANFFPAPYWTNDEWGFCWLSWQLYSRWGNAGLALFRSSLIVALFTLLYAGCRTGGLGRVPSLAWLALTWLMMRVRFAVRPHLFTDLFLALLVLLYLRARRGQPTGLPWLALPLFALWANLHAGVLAGLTLLGLWAAGEGIARLRGGGGDRLGLAASTLALALPATLLTPGSWHLYTYVAETFTRRQPLELVIEWWPVHAVWIAPYYFLFTGLVAVAMGGAAWARRLPPAFLTMSVPFAVLAFQHNRGVGELGAVAAPLAAAAAVEGWGALVLPRLAGWLPLARGAGLALGLAVFGALLVSLSARPVDLRTDPRDLPVGAVQYLRAHPVPGVILNTYHFGAFLVHQGLPAFVHGHTPTYPDSLLADFEAIQKDPARRAELLDRYHVGACLLAYAPARLSSGLLEHLTADPGWSLVYWDDTGVLFVRSPPATPAYRAVAPHLEDPFPTGDLQGGLREIARRLREDPECLRARCLQAEALMRLGDLKGAEAALQRVLALDPDSYEAHLKLGVLRSRQGDLEGALEELGRAVRLNRAAPVARFNLALAHALAARQDLEQGRAREASRHRAAALRQARWALRLDPGFSAARQLVERLEGG